MTRRSWAAIMLVSLLTIAGGAAFLYKTLQDKATMTAPLESVSSPAPTKNAPQEPTIEETKKTKEIAPAPEADKPAPAKQRNIQFVYINSSASNVYIVGNFDGKGKTVKKAMEKSRNKWTTTLKLEPGTYEYVYLVNGKSIRDPYNKKVSNGKSVLTVKPLPSN
jgi:1,4-alpha-glucan branching enzyme